MYPAIKKMVYKTGMTLCGFLPWKRTGNTSFLRVSHAELTHPSTKLGKLFRKGILGVSQHSKK